MAEGCLERFDLEFYKYVWNFHKTQSPKLEHIINQDISEKLLLRIKNHKQAESLLKHLSL